MNTNDKSQCDYCAFLHLEDQSNILSERAVEEKHSVLRNLIGGPKKTRKISVGGDNAKTETCFINSPNWTPSKNNQTHCDDFRDNKKFSFSDAMRDRDAKILLSRQIENLQAQEKSANITDPIHNPGFRISPLRIAEGVFIAFLSACLLWILWHYFHINLKP
jgi:hypothetical protein